ncbi:MAG: DUF488 family protein [Woeseia sp.]
MYYRRKLLLALIQGLDRPVDKIDLQKYLFLVCVDQERPAYEFIPHRFGCYSFQIDADKRTLTKYGLIKDVENWQLSGETRYLHLLTPPDRERVGKVVAAFRRLRGRKLIQHVYRAYPYYAINSQIREQVLTPSEQGLVEAARPKPASARLFTIGYEGKTLESYLNQLIVNRVKMLCDVRKNPVSMKFGFSKNPLIRAVNAVGIEYVHLPALGIASDKRRELETQDDYDALFAEYRQTTLAKNSTALDNVVALIRKHGRLALTCFESGAHQCHRGCVVDALTARSDFSHRVIHL